MGNITITGADVSELPLFNSAFVSTNAALHEDGTIRLTQNMHGVAAPMQGYSGNVSGAAAGMEQARTGVRDGSAAHRFFETLLGTSSADAAAAMIQSVSGETVVNAAWASNDALKLSLIHISEPTRLGMISYAVFCLKKKKRKKSPERHLLRHDRSKEQQ